MESTQYCFPICQKANVYGRVLHRTHIHDFNRPQCHDIHLMFEILTACLDSSSVLWLVQAGQPSAVAVNAQQIVSLLLPERRSSDRRVQRTVYPVMPCLERESG